MLPQRIWDPSLLYWLTIRSHRDDEGPCQRSIDRLIGLNSRFLRHYITTSTFNSWLQWSRICQLGTTGGDEDPLNDRIEVYIQSTKSKSGESNTCLICDIRYGNMNMIIHTAFWKLSCLLFFTRKNRRRKLAFCFVALYMATLSIIEVQLISHVISAAPTNLLSSTCHIPASWQGTQIVWSWTHGALHHIGKVMFPANLKPEPTG